MYTLQSKQTKKGYVVMFLMLCTEILQKTAVSPPQQILP
jgi:hypothetical protein